MNVLHFSPATIPDVQAFVDSLRPQVEEHIRQLRMLHDGIAPIPVEPNDLQTILSKLSAVRDGRDISLSLYEKQCLCFHIAEDICAPLRDFFLSQYIVSHWETECAKGLMHTLLLYWHTEHIVKPIWHIVNDHCSELSEVQRKAYRYMDKADAARKLGAYLLQNRVNVIYATDYVLLDRSMFVYPCSYFEDVMGAWFCNRLLSNDDLEILRTAVERYNHLPFSQVLLPAVIMYSDKRKDFGDAGKGKLISISQRAIGNINTQEKWQSSALNEEQRGNLLTARNILRKWMVEWVIRKVFHATSTGAYPDRAVFWRQYAKTLIEMNKDTRRTFIRVLSRDKDIRAKVPHSDYIDVKYLPQGISNTALVMRLGDYAIVELLGGGTMYIYRKHSLSNTSSDMYWRVFNPVSSINDVLSDVPVILRNQVNNTGIPQKTLSLKMAHRGDWQSSFASLLAQRGIFCGK